MTTPRDPFNVVSSSLLAPPAWHEHWPLSWAEEAVPGVLETAVFHA